MKDIWTALRKQVRERFDDSFHKHPRVAIFVTCKKEDSLQAVTAIVAITFRDAPYCKCLNLPTSPRRCGLRKKACTYCMRRLAA